VGDGAEPEGGGEVVVATEVGDGAVGDPGDGVGDADDAAVGEVEDEGEVVLPDGDALCAPGVLGVPVDDAVAEPEAVLVLT
jgi:hypothetical protein